MENQQARAYTAEAAARELGVSVQTVYNYLEDGRLTEFPVQGKARLVDGDSLRAALAIVTPGAVPAEEAVA